MTYAVLVMMRSGREYKLTVTDEMLDELYAHKDIGKSRVFVIGLSVDAPDAIPWHKFFPGTRLYREKKDIPKPVRVSTGSRSRKAKPRIAVLPAGPIEFMGAVDLHAPCYVSHM
ncbi:MAG: hypothetical protein BWY89_00992 [Bacteroidetes bacterium ADurb.BinA012]|nr:MAG: hypothetical protein BWY89_00992 [Bacteroidetes bacterium ADurb.BinA012]